MGIVNEPEGVDFVIKSDPLTEEEEKKLSEYIVNWKKQNKKRHSHYDNDGGKNGILNNEDHK